MNGRLVGAGVMAHPVFLSKNEEIKEKSSTRKGNIPIWHPQNFEPSYVPDVKFYDDNR